MARQSTPARVRERVRRTFLENVPTSRRCRTRSLTAEQKEFKALYNRGRRELEHEFGKTMRYRSIRDLVAGDSGLVVAGPQTGLAHESVERLRYAAARRRAVRRGHLRRGQPGDAGGGRPGHLSGQAGDRRRRSRCSCRRPTSLRLSQRRRRRNARRRRRNGPEGRVRSGQQQLPQSRRPQSAGHDARLALPQPHRIAHQLFQCRVLSGPAADRSRGEPAADRPGRDRRRAVATTAPTTSRACSNGRSAFISWSTASISSAATPPRRTTSPSSSAGLLAEESGVTHRHHRLFRGPARRDRAGPAATWHATTTTSATGSKRNWNAKRTANSSACSSRTWRTSRETSAT